MKGWVVAACTGGMKHRIILMIEVMQNRVLTMNLYDSRPHVLWWQTYMCAETRGIWDMERGTRKSNGFVYCLDCGSGFSLDCIPVSACSKLYTLDVYSFMYVSYIYCMSLHFNKALKSFWLKFPLLCGRYVTLIKSVNLKSSLAGVPAVIASEPWASAQHVVSLREVPRLDLSLHVAAAAFHVGLSF